MSRKLISSGSPWEPLVGYSRAVRAGNFIEVSGTTAIRNGVVQHHGDLYAQTCLCLEIIQEALLDAGSSLSDVVRTRMYVTAIERWEEAARAHAAFFGEIRPATTLVEVSALIDPQMLIEIEVSAITG